MAGVAVYEEEDYVVMDDGQLCHLGDEETSSCWDCWDCSSITRCLTSVESSPAAANKVSTTKVTLASSICSVVLVAYTSAEVEMLLQQSEMDKGLEVVMISLQTILVIVFVGELASHLSEEGLAYMSPRYPCRLLDAVVSMIGLFELVLAYFTEFSERSNVLRMIRLLRLVCVFRSMVLKEVRILVSGLGSFVEFSFWVVVCLMVLIYPGTLFCVILFNEGSQDVEQYFGSVTKGLFTHFQIFTREAWGDIADAAMKSSGHGWWAFYFIVCVLVINFGLLNVIVGAVCERIVQAKHREAYDADGIQFNRFDDQLEEFRSSLERFFSMCNLNKYGSISSDDFAKLWSLPEMQHLLVRMGVATEIASADLFAVMDVYRFGALSFNELSEALFRLGGSNKQLHSLMLRHDLAVFQENNMKHLDFVEQDLVKHIKKEFDNDSETLSKKELSIVEGHLERLKMEMNDRIHRDRLLKAARSQRTPSALDDPLFAARISKRLYTLVGELDAHISKADEIFSGSCIPSRARIHAGTQTHATIDYMDGMSGKAAGKEYHFI